MAVRLAKRLGRILGRCPMEQNAEPITRQVVIVGVILVSAAALSLGIRQLYPEANKNPVTSEPEKRPGPEHLLGLDPFDSDEQSSSVSGQGGTAVSTTGEPKPGAPTPGTAKPAPPKPEDSKVIQKIPLGENEELYITADGKLWSVSKQPDGSVVKMQVEIDEATGEIRVLDIANGGKADASKEPQRIPMGDDVSIYIGDDGRLWSVTKQPDGSTTKVEVAYDETTGDFYVLDVADSNNTEK